MSETLKQRAYSYLFQKLCNGELRPGDRLSGRSVAKEIGVSPIPVRDAIGQLNTEGFFETRHGGGTFVPEPSYEDLMDIYDQREALECHAVMRIAESPEAQVLEALDKCGTELTALLDALIENQTSKNRTSILAQWSRVDAEFHDTIMRAAGNRRSLETVLHLRVRTRIYGLQIHHESIDSLRHTCGLHETILERIRNKDAEGARLAMMEHIRSACRLLIEAHYRKQGKLNVSVRKVSVNTDAN
ncbi:GntR family transcriptional regulator [Adhaeretor mobilis]|uniref:GntR family transcriptional regulator n=1 Tax=Adhaeretor mobilis TaxID=1930276 RepID=UPI001C54D23D|nr:GntR family transcriptional regulator [Adhaeretor mobilis]